MNLDIFFTRKKSNGIGYFKKINFLIKYFEDLGFDVENQIPFRVNKEDIEVLLSRCKQVLKNHDLAEELLPIMEGFGGASDYDESYFDDVKVIRNYLRNNLLPEFDKLQDDESIYFEILC